MYVGEYVCLLVNIVFFVFFFFFFCYPFVYCLYVTFDNDNNSVNFYNYVCINSHHYSTLYLIYYVPTGRACKAVSC